MQKQPRKLPVITASILLLLGGFLSWPHGYSGYYLLSGFVACIVSIYLAVLAYQWRKISAVWLFASIAVLFNPLVPIRLGLNIRAAADVVCAVIFVVALFSLKKPIAESGTPETQP